MGNALRSMSVCLRIDRGPIVRSSVGSGTYLMTLISMKPWGSHRIPASRKNPSAAAVTREAEEDWGKKKWR